MALNYEEVLDNMIKNQAEMITSAVTWHAPYIPIALAKIIFPDEEIDPVTFQPKDTRPDYMKIATITDDL